MWSDKNRIKKYLSFFRPGVTADIVKIDAEQRLVGIKLITLPKEGTSTAKAAEVSTVA